MYQKIFIDSRTGKCVDLDDSISWAFRRVKVVALALTMLVMVIFPFSIMRLASWLHADPLLCSHKTVIYLLPIAIALPLCLWDAVLEARFKTRHDERRLSDPRAAQKARVRPFKWAVMNLTLFLGAVVTVYEVTDALYMRVGYQ